MKSRTLLLMAHVLVFTAVLTSCSKDNEEKEENELFLRLYENSVIMDIPGGERVIQLTANTEWEVREVPAWVTVTPASGNGSAGVTIQVGETREPEERINDILFISKDITQTLQVKQHGLRDMNRSPLLPITSFKNIHINSQNYHYQVVTTGLFVNPDIRKKIFIGNMVSPTLQKNTSIPTFTGYTYNPVTVSSSAIGEITTYIPSFEAEEAYVKQILATNPNAQYSLGIDDGSTEFYTYKQLHAIGVVNLGVKLEEVISGYSFREKEMRRKYGVILCYRQTQFTVDMDLPEKNLVQEEIKADDKAQGVSYVASVSYGKVGLLIAESDTDSREVRMAINKVIRSQPLTQTETDLLSDTDITYVWFDNENRAQSLKGGQNAIDAYIHGVNNKENIYPINFLMADYFDDSPSDITFSVQIPD